MDDRTLKIFQREVRRQCEFALIAAQELDKAEHGLDEIERRWEEFEQTPMTPQELAERYQKQVDQTWASLDLHSTHLWYSVQSLFVAIGNISKLLWPSNRRNRGKPLIPERGRQLRESLSVGEDSVLRSRALRNHLEHFDERIEQWAVSPWSEGFFDSTIRSSGVGTIGDPQANFRGYIVEQRTITFGEKAYPLQRIIDEVQTVLDRVRNALAEA